MIILLLDIGNTSVKIGIADQQTILTSYVMPTDIRQGSDCLGLQMTSFLQHAELAEKKSQRGSCQFCSAGHESHREASLSALFSGGSPLRPS